MFAARERQERTVITASRGGGGGESLSLAGGRRRLPSLKDSLESGWPQQEDVHRVTGQTNIACRNESDVAFCCSICLYTLCEVDFSLDHLTKNLHII